MVSSAPAAVQPLRRSVLVGGLASLAVLAPIVGFAVSWSRAGRGSTLFAPLRTTDQPGGLVRLLLPGNTTPFTVGDPLVLPGSGEAVHTYGSGGFRGGVAFIDHAADPVFVALSASGPALAGITDALLVVLLLARLRSIAAREPFAAANAGRLAAAAVVLLVLAAAVRRGARLTVETEGLV